MHRLKITLIKKLSIHLHKIPIIFFTKILIDLIFVYRPKNLFQQNYVFKNYLFKHQLTNNRTCRKHFLRHDNSPKLCITHKTISYRFFTRRPKIILTKFRFKKSVLQKSANPKLHLLKNISLLKIVYRSWWKIFNRLYFYTATQKLFRLNSDYTY